MQALPEAKPVCWLVFPLLPAVVRCDFPPRVRVSCRSPHSDRQHLLAPWIISNVSGVFQRTSHMYAHSSQAQQLSASVCTENIQLGDLRSSRLSYASRNHLQSHHGRHKPAGYCSKPHTHRQELQLRCSAVLLHQQLPLQRRNLQQTTMRPRSCVQHRITSLLHHQHQNYWLALHKTV